jgi:hypothetical protein
MKNKVDRKSLKESKKDHKKALRGTIVLKDECPISKTDCLHNCEEMDCKKV